MADLILRKKNDNTYVLEFYQQTKLMDSMLFQGINAKDKALNHVTYLNSNMVIPFTFEEK